MAEHECSYCPFSTDECLLDDCYQIGLKAQLVAESVLSQNPELVQHFAAREENQ